jgi:hypothetical protein
MLIGTPLGQAVLSRLNVYFNAVTNTIASGGRTFTITQAVLDKVAKRNIYLPDIQNTILRGREITYLYWGQNRLGYYDASRNLFIGVSDKAKVMTAFHPKDGIEYINQLMRHCPK